MSKVAGIMKMGRMPAALVHMAMPTFLWTHRPMYFVGTSVVIEPSPHASDARWYLALKPPSRRARRKEAVRLGLKKRFKGRGRRRIERAPVWTKGAKYSAAEIEELATASRMMSRTVSSIMRAQGLLPEETPCQDK